MVSVTSIVPSGITIVSDWKFSMRSSRVLKAEVTGKIKARTRATMRNARIVILRTRVISSATPGSCAEADFGSFPFGGGGHFKEFARLESEHVRGDVRGELLDFGVEIANHGIIIAARVLDGVFDLSEGSLQ